MDQELLKYVKTLAKLGVAAMVLLIIYLLYYKVGHVFLQFLSALPGYIMPFLIAIFFVVLLEPLIGFFQHRLKLGRGLATFFSMILALGVLFTLLGLLINRMISELIELYKWFSDHSSEIGQTIFHTAQQVLGIYHGLHLPPSVESGLKNNLGSVVGGLQNLTMSMVQGLEGFITGLPGFFIIVIVTIVATYFLAKDRPIIWAWFMRPIPDLWEERTRNIGSHLGEAFMGFLRAQGILILITAVQTIIGLLILRVPYAVTMGLIIGLCDIVPLAGPGVVYIPWIIWEFSSGNPGLAVGLAVVWVSGIIIRQLLEPKIIGQQLGLHPLATMASLYIGMKAIGAAGIVLGPVTVILFMACKRAGVFEFIRFSRRE